METLSSDGVEGSNEVESTQKGQTLEDVENSFYVQNVSRPTYRYTKDQLLKLRNHPFSTKVPALCDHLKFLFVNNLTKTKEKDDSDTKKIPMKKHGLPRPFDQPNEKLEPKRNETIRTTDKLKLGPNFRTDKTEDSMKVTDPASRLRKEQDICLSPQRKSFNTGCSVQNASKEIDGNNSPLNGNVVKASIQREITATNGSSSNMRDNRTDVKESRSRDMPNRRYGSGRIISSDPSAVMREYPDNRIISKEKSQIVYKYTFQKSDKDREGLWDRQKNSTYYERRKHVDQHHDDEDGTKDRFWDHNRTSGNVFDRRRYQGSGLYNNYHHHDDEEKEPEWMKDGPDSRHDVIELRGFDENEVKYFRKGLSNTRTFHKTGSDLPKSTVNSKEQSNQQNSELDNTSAASNLTLSKAKENASLDTKEDGSTVKEKKETVVNEKPMKPPEATSIEINLEEIFKTSLTDFMGENKTVDNVGSRFTRWFKRDDARTSLTATDEQPTERITLGQVPGLNSLMDDTSEKRSVTQVMSDAVSQCESKTSDSVSQRIDNKVQTSSLLDLLRVSQENTSVSVPPTKMDVRTLEATGKLHSLEEIEAKLRGIEANKQNALNVTTSASDRKKKEEEAEAFKKLLYQALQYNQSSGSLKTSLRNYSNISHTEAQRMKSETARSSQGKELSSILCNGDAVPNFSNRVTTSSQSRMPPVNQQHTQHHHHQQQQQFLLLQQQHQLQQQQQQQQHPHYQQQSADVLKLFQQQQQQSKSQEIFSKMLMCSASSYNSPISTTSFSRTNSSPTIHGPYSHISQEIQVLVNNCHMSPELMQRPETVNILKAIRNGDLTTHHLIEQLKKTTPYQTKFRESAICVLKILQTHSPPFFPSPVPLRTYMPPFMESASSLPTRSPGSAVSHAPTQNFGENMIQKIMMSQQYRNTTIPDIIYQRDFSPSANQNVSYQNNSPGRTAKNHVSMQPSNQASTRINSSLMTSACSSNNAANSITVNTCRDDTGKTVGSANSPNTITTAANDSTGLANSCSSIGNSGSGTTVPKSLSFMPTSVLLKLSAEKENLDITLPKDLKEFKTDGTTRSTNFVSQSTPNRGSFSTGTISNGEDQLNRFFSLDNANQSRLMNSGIGNSSVTLQNIISVEEIERVQQSVRN